MLTVMPVPKTQPRFSLERRNIVNRSRKAAKAANTLPPDPTIAVVGLRFGQGAELASRCGGVAKLKFVNADQSETVLPEADAVFLLTRFIQHRWMDASLRSFPRRRVYLHGGGITTLANRIVELVGTAMVA